MDDLTELDGALNRRAMLKGATAGIGLTVLSGVVLSSGGCASNKSQEKIPLISTGIVPIGTPAEYPAGTVSNKLMNTYGIAISNDAGTITAIVPKCTHRGCIASWDWNKNLFICPCHGSHFDIEGRPVKGPAVKYMARVPVIANADGTLSVDLDKLYSLVPATPKA